MRHGLHPAAALRHVPPADPQGRHQPDAGPAPRPRSSSSPRPLGYHEAWVGEHHSAGSELIASPEVFIAAAAERTKHIKLGTGVNSLPYHHPFMLADRIVMLDHLTRGRMMFGVGPGQLTSDAMMLGIDPQHQRPRMEEAFDVIMRLFRGETVTEKTDWFTCDKAVLQMQPYSDFDIAVAASISPSGSKLAGRYGAGLLSIAATDPMGFEMLAGHWQVWNEQAAEHGHTVVAIEVAADGADAHRRHLRAGQGELLATACSGSSTTLATSSRSAPSRCPTDYDELRRHDERDRAGRDRHAGDGHRPDRAADRASPAASAATCSSAPTWPTGGRRCATTSCSPKRSCRTSPASWPGADRYDLRHGRRAPSSSMPRSTPSSPRSRSTRTSGRRKQG